MPTNIEIDILAFEQDLRRTYERYIYTANLISDQEPELQDAFAQRIREGFNTFKDPYVHCTPCYRQAENLQQLIKGKEGIQLATRMSSIPEEQFNPSRPLYSHQVEALRILGGERNLVVATGTGSGKTECFLLPILDHILKIPGPGLRAIIIYPMNALADDQLGRLRKLLATTPEVTFGRYTGDTAEDVDDAVRPPEVVANERYTRREIRANPPNILLTNFAMLEYLLLRPRDSDIFAANRLQFIVLDEAHTYSGAQGIEIALLMRRLREYLVKADQNLQFVLTSATLGNEEETTAKVVQFANDISGAEFSEDDVLQGETVDEFSDELTSFPDRAVLLRIGRDEEEFTAWGNALTNTNQLADRLTEVGIKCPNPADKPPAQLLFELLASSESLNRVHQQCHRQPSTLLDLCELLDLPQDEVGKRAIQWLVTMGAFARRSPDSAPLLPTRFHFFARGLSGASVCLAEACPAKKTHPNTSWSAFYLEDRNVCQECENRVLPLATCVHCGLPACRVFLVDGKWQVSTSPYRAPRALVLVWADQLEEEEEQEEMLDQTAWLCLSCGNYAEGADKSPCPADHASVRLKVLSTDMEGNLKTCPRCGGQSRNFPSVLRDFKSQENAPTAVLAEAVIRNLPFDAEDPDKVDLPANGRNLLVFSDARQRAAFFAPYLAQTTLETAYMGPLVRAIGEAEKLEGRPVTFEEAARAYVRVLGQLPIAAVKKREESGVEYFDLVPRKRLRSADRTAARHEAEILLLGNFTASYRSKTTLPGAGVAAIKFDFNEEERKTIPKRVPELFKGGEDQGWAILHALLGVFLLRKAIALPDGISLRDILDPGPDMVTFHFSLSSNRGGRQVVRWNPYSAEPNAIQRAVRASRQLDILARTLCLDKEQDATQLNDLMTRIWDCFKDTMLLAADGCPGEYRVDPELIQISRKIQWGMCARCGRLTDMATLGFCLTPRCVGKVGTLTSAECTELFEKNHYRQRYFLPPLAVVVKEHTAQLTNERGKEYQRRFMRGEINVLSSSTTFEMGVDVGALKAVLMRNVPPTTSSYIQRAGRAGRRKDGISVALTFCRNMPHDQYNYQFPETIILGEVPAPYLNLKNEPLTQRHCNSLLLGYFLRSIQTDESGTLDRLTIEAFFLDKSSGSTLAERYIAWLSDPTTQESMRRSLAAIFPADSAISPDSAISESAESLLKDDASVFQDYVRSKLDRLQEQFQEIEKQMSETSGKSRIALARSSNSLERLIKQFKEDRLIDFLSSSSWLPGYAFPQDVVKLLVRHTEYGHRMRLERDREVGISEYAPGAEIVADGFLFTSCGIWFNSKEPDIQQYARCPECRKIDKYLESERPSRSCSRCGTELKGKFRSRFYIRPDGFTTLVTDLPQRPGRSRRPGARASEVFLLEGAANDEFKPHPVKGVSFAEKQNGRLFLANSGYQFQGYHICRKCGRGFPQTPTGRTHQTPWGTDCSGRTKVLDLAHEIRTDILQLRFQRCTPAAPFIIDRPFWLSFVATFLNGASDALNIDAGDLGGTYHGWSEESYVGELVVYDRIPGGAGHITRIIDQLDEVLDAALKRVRDCKCSDLEASCYACLRSYANQFYWEELKRRPVIEWLGNILGKA
jgi:superfamily II DNA/RNA helicase